MPRRNTRVAPAPGHRPVAGLVLGTLLVAAVAVFPLVHGATVAPVAASTPAAYVAGPDYDAWAHGLPSTTPTVATTAAPAAPAPAAPAGEPVQTLSEDGIPVVALDAYHHAADLTAKSDPGCHLDWPLLAAIGRVESDHGQFGGAQLYADGSSFPHIIGIALDGTASAPVPDTDHGVLDGDPVWDHAIGPMQIIPGTWARHAIDANGDGKADPFNIVDAAATAGAYLCAGGRDVSTPAGRTAAVTAYNSKPDYITTVLALADLYAGQPPVTTPPPASTPPAPVTSTPPASTPPPATPTPTPTPTCPTPTGTPSGSPTASPTPTGTGCPTDPTTPPSSPSPTRDHGHTPTPSPTPTS